MSDASDRGITVTELAAMDEPIPVAAETTTAFVGRALRGPLNTPVLIQHFGDFRRRFGDSWSRSSLGPAVKQFFEHGGKQLYVVRVANNARGAMLCLPASGSALVLRAFEPGSTERLRAAVDYDGIADAHDDLFNLTLQRIDPVKATVVDQEMYRRVSYREDADSFIGDVLLASTLARLEKPWPTHRPEPTTSPDSRYELTWAVHEQEGTDGGELSDYDLIGSRDAGTGLFALDQIEHFDLLYLPPPGKQRDAGPAAIMAADLYCRERGAMLLTDPAAAWRTAADAVRGVREYGYASPNMLCYFPRMRHRLDADDVARAAGGALAGILCRLDRSQGRWRSLADAASSFVRGLRPAVALNDDEAKALVRAGLNVVREGDARQVRIEGSVTLSRGNDAQREFASLSVRRFCLGVVSAIDRATRWAVFEQPDERLRRRMRAHVEAYFSDLVEHGALADRQFVVQVDASELRREQGVTMVIVFHPQGSPAPISLTLHQTAAGCRVASTAFAPIAVDCA